MKSEGKRHSCSACVESILDGIESRPKNEKILNAAV